MSCEDPPERKYSSWHTTLHDELTGVVDDSHDTLACSTEKAGQGVSTLGASREHSEHDGTMERTSGKTGGSPSNVQCSL